MSILKLQNVVKAYSGHLAVDDVSFEMPEGCIFGLLGPNGAGKTTLIRIITTIIRADSGVVYLSGERLNSNHPSQIGYLPEERGLYKKMKVGEHLLYLARLKGIEKGQAENLIDEWLEKFELADWKQKKVEALSKGMQQKIQFISTILHEPKLLILDEPFSGLDPVNTNLIKNEIRELQAKGASIIFSTHRMEQVEEICEHIVLIDKGKNVLEGKVDEIKERFKKNHFRICYKGTAPSIDPAYAKVLATNKDCLTMQLQAGTDSRELMMRLLDSDTYIHSFEEILPSLNEIFIEQVSEKEVF